MLLFKDSIRLFAAYNEGVINMLGEHLGNLDRFQFVLMQEHTAERDSSRDPSDPLPSLNASKESEAQPADSLAKR